MGGTYWSARLPPATGRRIIWMANSCCSNLQVGIMDAEGFSVNIPWSCGGVGDNDYIYAFQHVVLPIGHSLEFAPDITIVSAGFDAARGDPLGCCDVRTFNLIVVTVHSYASLVTPAGYAQMTHMLTSISEGKLLVILEGGFVSHSFGWVVLMFFFSVLTVSELIFNFPFTATISVQYPLQLQQWSRYIHPVNTTIEVLANLKSNLSGATITMGPGCF
ncbi:hypothetical protein GW17_00031374 [Ensete ventricosum]|nr:hypothetical protein GW17_00031374 [Ensete ventricosum]